MAKHHKKQKHKIKDGDIVGLKSAQDQLMTVEIVHEELQVADVVYFSFNGNLNRESIKLVCLEKRSIETE